jgi:hypothetical protein
MKALFFPLYIATPHFETDLEIISRNIEQGNEIFVIVCNGEMPTCLNNTEHSLEGCIACKSIVKRGLKAAGVLHQNILHLPRKQPSYRVIQRRVNDIKELKDFKIEGVDIGAAAASTLFFTHDKEHKLDTKVFAYDVYRELKLGWYIYTFFFELVKRMKPDVVYIFNGRFSAPRMMMRVCEKLGVTFYTHERAGLMNRFWIRKNTLPHDIATTSREIAEWWESARDNREHLAKRWYIERREGIDQGYYSFTKNQSPGALPRGFDVSKKNVAIFNSTLEEIVAIPGWDNTIYDDDAGGIRRILAYFQNNPKFHFYFRVHPNLKGCRNTQVKEIEKIKNDFSNVTVIPAHSRIHSYKLIDSCAQTLVFSSTVGVESCFWGTPMILLAHAMYESLDCCYKPKSHEEVISLIKSDLSPKPVVEALKYGYWSVKLGESFKYFHQTRVNEGLFLGKKICKLNPWVIVFMYSVRLFKTKAKQQIGRKIKEMVNKWILPRIPLIKRMNLRV